MEWRPMQAQSKRKQACSPSSHVAPSSNLTLRVALVALKESPTTMDLLSKCRLFRTAQMQMQRTDSLLRCQRRKDAKFRMVHAEIKQSTLVGPFTAVMSMAVRGSSAHDIGA